MDRVKEFLVSKALLKGDTSTTPRPLRRLRGESVSFVLVSMLFLFSSGYISYTVIQKKDSVSYMKNVG